MIFEDAYEHNINRQDYITNRERSTRKKKTNRTKIVIEAMMTMKLACITVFLCLFFRYWTSWPWKHGAMGRNRTFWYPTKARCIEPLRPPWQNSWWWERIRESVWDEEWFGEDIKGREGLYYMESDSEHRCFGSERYEEDIFAKERDL